MRHGIENEPKQTLSMMDESFAIRFSRGRLYRNAVSNSCRRDGR